MRKTRKSLSILLLGALAASLIAAASPAPAAISSASLPPALAFTPIVNGLTQPVFVTNAADGSNRLFILERAGKIRIFKSGGLLATPFLDISGVTRFTYGGTEQGLLGLAFDPGYSSNGYFYITYTVTTNDATYPYAVRLVRYKVSGGDPDIADPASGALVLSYKKKYTNHNGGMIAFGPDGYLYWGTGDGGSGGDPDNNAQNIHRLLGKILRLDVDGTPLPGKLYGIPATNPFYGSSDATIRQEIWSVGVRNPWRWSFDRLTGDLFIGDVGQNREEEIDFQAAGSTGLRNYGWRILEGNLCYNPATGCTHPANYVAPVAVYDHGTHDSYGCSVTGGYVYRGSASPSLQGVHFYGDFCRGKVFGLVKTASGWKSKLVASTPYGISSFGEDEQGELYLADFGGGQIVKISAVTLVTDRFVSEGSLDGTVIESSETSSQGGSKNAAGQTLTVGDTALRKQKRAILSFDTSSLPDGAVITSAKIRVKLSSISTPSPFTTLGKLTVDLGTPHFGQTSGLEKLDFQAAATKSSVATFGSTPSAGWYAAFVYKGALGSISRTGQNQFRLRFATDDNNDAVANYAAFFSGDAATATDRPMLVVQYYMP